MSRDSPDDFFGIQYEQVQPQDKSESPARSTLKEKVSGTEFIDSAFFGNMSERQHERSEHISEAVTDPDDPYADYFIRNKEPTNEEAMPSLPRNSPMKVPKRSVQKLEVIETADFFEPAATGFEKLTELIEPVWKFSNTQLVDFLAARVIYDGEDLIGFDKPYQLPYSGATNNTPQFDRVLQDLKKVVAPGVDRLCLVKSLDKGCSGVMLFAKSVEAQKQYLDMMANNQIEFTYQALLKNIPKRKEAIINVPLQKFLFGKDMELRPLLDQSNTKKRIFHASTTYSVKATNPSCHASYSHVIVKHEVPHQIRAHLAYGIGCPIFGDHKYTRIGQKTPQALHADVLARFECSKAQARKMPMFLHCREAMIPINKSGSRYMSVKAPLPEFFRFAMKRLSLLRK